MANSKDNESDPTAKLGHIEAKIAAVISKREVVINRGAADFVQEGMRFAIVGSSEEIPDPDDPTRNLGSVELVKAVMKVVRLNGDHLSILRTFRTVPGSGGVFGTSFSTFAAISGRPPRVETIELNPDDPPLSDRDESFYVISVGDRAVQTIGEEYDELA